MIKEKLYYNSIQQRSMNVMCSEEVYVIARGGGKTTGIMAPRIRTKVLEMPGSRGGIVSPSYTKAWTNTLPPVISGLKNLGLVEGVHFVVRKRPPDWFRKSIVTPEDFENVISFWNGSHIVVLSQDRKGSANGASFDWLICDEAKLIDKQRFDSEIMPAMRGNRELFGDHPLHHSVMFLTDRPDGINGRWITAKKSRMDKDLIRYILLEQLQINKLEEKQRDTGLTQKYRSELRKIIKRKRLELVPFRKKGVYYCEASALENIEILGVDYFYKQEKQLPRILFMTSILNIATKRIEDGYYPNLNPDVHTYIAPGVEYSNPYITNKTSDTDADVCTDEPLHLGCDYGSRINTVVVGQKSGNTLNVVNALYVKAPLKCENLADKFCRYYKNHGNKTIHYYFDSTAQHFRSTGDSYLDVWKKALKKNGWTVKEHFIGRTPGHDKRMILASNVFNEDNLDVCDVRFNSVNCNFLLLSMQLAGVSERKHGLEKDKSSERNPNVPDEEATDFSDAFDTLLWGVVYKANATSTGWIP